MVNEQTENRLSALEEQIKALELLKQQIEQMALNEVNNISHPPHNHVTTTKYKPTTIDKLDHDMLLIGDSNVWPVNEKILKHGVSSAKIMTYTIEQATSAIQNLNISRLPEKVLVHVGTNNLSSKEGETNDLDAIKAKYENLFEALEEKFPSTRIYISELLLRREDIVMDDLKNINEFLTSTCQARENFSTLLHSFNIDHHHHHLRDNRHLSRSGFYIFLSNIRLQMLGIPPKNKHSSRQFRPRRR